MARFRSLGDRANRTEIRAGVVLGDPDDDTGQREADQRAIEQVHTVEFNRIACVQHGVHVTQCELRGTIDQRDRQNGGDDEALVHRAHNIAAIAETDKIGADDRSDDTSTADQQRKRHHRQQQIAEDISEQQSCQNHRRANGHDIGLEQIGCHTSAVTNIVAHVIGDGCRVAWIVFRNAGFDLPDKVSANISSLGENTAAETCEDRDQRRTESETYEAIDDDAVVRSELHRSHEHIEEYGDREKRETCHEHASDGTCAEGDGEALLQALFGGSCGPYVRTHRDVHPDIAGNARQNRADHKTDRRDVTQRDADDHCSNHTDDADGGVLAVQIGLCAFLNCACNFLHFFIASARAEHLAAGDEAIHDGKHTQPD